jgi:hypothetical protein
MEKDDSTKWKVYEHLKRSAPVALTFDEYATQQAEWLRCADLSLSEVVQKEQVLTRQRFQQAVKEETMFNQHQERKKTRKKTTLRPPPNQCLIRNAWQSTSLFVKK